MYKETKFISGRSYFNKYTTLHYCVYLKELRLAFHHLFHYTCLFFSNLINFCAILHTGLSKCLSPFTAWPQHGHIPFYQPRKLSNGSVVTRVLEHGVTQSWLTRKATLPTHRPKPTSLQSFPAQLPTQPPATRPPAYLSPRLPTYYRVSLPS